MKGQSLIEVLVALAIAIVVVTAITVTSLSSLNSAQYIRDQDQASKYAQEGIEVVRAIRNNSYIGFRAYGGATPYCLNEGEASLSAGPCTTPNVSSKFVRSVLITLNGCAANISRVTVTVAFTSGKCTTGTYCHTSRLVSCLTTINPVPAP